MGRRAAGQELRRVWSAYLVFADGSGDWDCALRWNNGTVNPLGLYDLDRKIRPVGRAYKKLISEWSNVLPAQSVCLAVPLVMPKETDEPFAVRRRRMMAELLRNSHMFTQAAAEEPA